MTIPAHALALRAPSPSASASPGAGPPADHRRIVRSRSFLLLAASLTLSGFAMFGVVIGLVPLLTERGASATTAAWALGLGGLGQTLGRTLYAAVARRTGATARTVVLIAAGGRATALLALVPGPVPLLIALAMLAGMVRGNLTLLKATAVADRWGTAAYGRLSGVLAAPVTVATALAPFVGAALAGPLGSYSRVFLVLAGLSTAAALLAAGTSPRRLWSG